MAVLHAFRREGAFALWKHGMKNRGLGASRRSTALAHHHNVIYLSQISLSTEGQALFSPPSSTNTYEYCHPQSDTKITTKSDLPATESRHWVPWPPTTTKRHAPAVIVLLELWSRNFRFSELCSHYSKWDMGRFWKCNPHSLTFCSFLKCQYTWKEDFGKALRREEGRQTSRNPVVFPLPFWILSIVWHNGVRTGEGWDSTRRFRFLRSSLCLM